MSTSAPTYPVIELRRYTLVEGAAARFSRCFETWFPEAFQQAGAIALGHFVERGHADRFTWLRAFADMDARLAANTAFYDGPVWQEHKATLNGWIVDSDNVLLLRPLYPGAALPTLPAVDPVAEPHGARGLAVAQLFQAAPGRFEACAGAAERWFGAYRGDGLVEAGVLATLEAVNNFPRHPVRSDGGWLVWIGILRDERALAALRPALAAAARDLAAGALLASPPELVVLDPGLRSRLRWMQAAGAHDTLSIAKRNRIE